MTIRSQEKQLHPTDTYHSSQLSQPYLVLPLPWSQSMQSCSQQMGVAYKKAMQESNHTFPADISLTKSGNVILQLLQQKQRHTQNLISYNMITYLHVHPLLPTCMYPFFSHYWCVKKNSSLRECVFMVWTRIHTHIVTLYLEPNTVLATTCVTLLTISLRTLPPIKCTKLHRRRWNI